MKRIYLINIWNQLITERGISLLESRGYEVAGNWLDSNFRKDIVSFRPDLVVYAVRREEDKTLHTLEKLNYPFVAWSLFPDDNVGWDQSNNTYRMENIPFFKKVLDSKNRIGPLLVNSNFTRNLILKSYPLSEKSIKTVYLGIDINGISISRGNMDERIRVLWNHKWRSDKGFREALDMTYSLARRYPLVHFTIGNKETWREDEISIAESKLFYEQFKEKTRIFGNIDFVENIKSALDYWNFLSKYNLSFSTSHHESFGLGILESSLLHATIVPNREVYPEIYNYVSENVFEDICKAIESKSFRERLRIEREETARKFSIDTTVDNLSEFIKN